LIAHNFSVKISSSEPYAFREFWRLAPASTAHLGKRVLKDVMRKVISLRLQWSKRKAILILNLLGAYVWTSGGFKDGTNFSVQRESLVIIGAFLHPETSSNMSSSMTTVQHNPIRS
jgi:hypothetical protein